MILRVMRLRNAATAAGHRQRTRHGLPAVVTASLMLLTLVSGGATGVPVAVAGTADPDSRLTDCLTLAETNPDAAAAEATAWEQENGGFAAQLCQAMVLFYRGQFDTAAGRLEELATFAEPVSPATALTLRSRAAWSWLRAGNPERALTLYDSVLALHPDDLDLRIDRAFACAEAGRFADAVAELGRVLEREPRLFDAWLYRAAAYRHLENYPEALRDVEKALALRPDDPGALLLRGNLRALSADSRGALDDWRRVIKLAPETPAGQAAATNTTRLSTQEALPAVPPR